MSMIIRENSATPQQAYNLTLAFQRTLSDGLPKQITTEPTVRVAGSCIDWTSPSMKVEHVVKMLAEYDRLEQAGPVDGPTADLSTLSDEYAADPAKRFDLSALPDEHVDVIRACIDEAWANCQSGDPETQTNEDVAADIAQRLHGAYGVAAATETETGITHRIDWPEDSDIALNECCWYDNQYQLWARVACTGRMARVYMLNGGQPVTDATMCEGHVNAYNGTN